MKGRVTGSEPLAMIACSKRHDLRRAVLGAHFELVHGDEPAGPGDDADLALLGETGKAAGEALDDAVLPAAQLAEVDRRLGERDAVGAHVAAFGDDLGGVQQRLRRDAADVEADAAETSASARPAPPSCRDRRPGRPRCSRRDRHRAPAPRRGCRRRRRRAAWRSAPAPCPRPAASAGRGRDLPPPSRIAITVALGDAVPDLDLHLADGAALRPPAPPSSPCRIRA